MSDHGDHQRSGAGAHSKDYPISSYGKSARTFVQVSETGVLVLVQESGARRSEIAIDVSEVPRVLQALSRAAIDQAYPRGGK